MLKSIRILIAIAAFHDYEIWQMDVKIAFLNGKLSEDVYMTQPEGFVQSEHPNRVCKLQKSIYGLKQASRSWNIYFDEKIEEFGFLRSEDEPCVYVRTSGSIVVFLVLYVDDILLMGNDIPTLQSVKTWLGKCFSMKDMGDATYILGIKIYRDRSRRLISLSQSTYIDKVLKKFNMQDSKNGFIPMQHGLALSKAQCPSSSSELERMSWIPYALAIGSIMYAMICTRPDVSYALSMTSRYQANPGNDHWTAVKNILKYLRRTKEMFLVYGGAEELSVKGYTDASFQTDRDDSCSQLGFVFLLNGGAVSWRSSKQSTVADSTTEAEYIAVNEAAKEAVWMKKFIGDLDPIEIFCDNEGAVILAKESRSHKRTRHILRKFHYVRKVVEDRDIIISRVGTDGNLADPFTKPLSQTKHDAHTSDIHGPLDDLVLTLNIVCLFCFRYNILFDLYGLLCTHNPTPPPLRAETTSAKTGAPAKRQQPTTVAQRNTAADCRRTNDHNGFCRRAAGRTTHHRPFSHRRNNKRAEATTTTVPGASARGFRRHGYGQPGAGITPIKKTVVLQLSPTYQDFVPEITLRRAPGISPAFLLPVPKSTQNLSDAATTPSRSRSLCFSASLPSALTLRLASQCNSCSRQLECHLKAHALSHPPSTFAAEIRGTYREFGLILLVAPTNRPPSQHEQEP
ncbi:hypothetical protein OSB04_024793 [Centaurea solstitialis]|uniref:Reverse transcriptase Ty1/copia-type domain-containing protein n=1 Tax=Centaurea solstitialis TaxID=347529 RepID=A0AA38T078_9ASTR|nr:hypothetical protein OSB04_024793 [Centaurea solstitialis]